MTATYSNAGGVQSFCWPFWIINDTKRDARAETWELVQESSRATSSTSEHKHWTALVSTCERKPKQTHMRLQSRCAGDGNLIAVKQKFSLSMKINIAVARDIYINGTL